jgi:hypothetical protein
VEGEVLQCSAFNRQARVTITFSTVGLSGNFTRDIDTTHCSLPLSTQEFVQEISFPLGLRVDGFLSKGVLNNEMSRIVMGQRPELMQCDTHWELH